MHGQRHGLVLIHAFPHETELVLCLLREVRLVAEGVLGVIPLLLLLLFLLLQVLHRRERTGVVVLVVS
jgi:hypothetical protein